MSKKRKIEVTSEDDFENNKEDLQETQVSSSENKDIEEGNMEEKILKNTEETEEDTFIELEKLKKELEEVKAKERDNRESFLRARADYENLRKRSEAQVGMGILRGKKAIVSSILDVLDNFERALNVDETTVSAKNILIGVRMIHKQLKSVLEDEGLKEIDTLGNIFDPRYHEAVESVISNEYKDEEIIGEFVKGYQFKDELLRPAKVKVARNNSSEKEATGDEENIDT